ncbi:cadherin and PC-esterase domain-containing protein 1, partial [Biomphalaria glabrata]
IESSITPPTSEVLVRCPLSSLKHHLYLTEAAFQRYGAHVVMDEGISQGKEMKPEIWSIVMCMNTPENTSDCFEPALEIYQKVNVMPELLRLLRSPFQLCACKNLEGNTGQWLKGKLECFLEEEMGLTPCNNTSDWWLVGRQHIHGQFISCPSRDSQVHNVSDEAVWIKLPYDRLKINGFSFIWQVEVLVTSLSPLRIYMHPNGILWENIENIFDRKHQKTLSILDLRQLFTELTNEKVSNYAMENLDSAILDAFNSLSEIENYKSHERSCLRCFQVFNVFVIFNSTFDSFILQIKPYSSTGDLITLNDYLMEQSILEDLPAMLVTREPTARQVATVLSILNIRYIRQGQLCNQDESLCLQREDLIFLLDTRKEQRTVKSWIRLSPSSYSSKEQGTGNVDSVNISLEALVLFMEQYFVGNKDTSEQFKTTIDPIINILGNDSINELATVESGFQFYKIFCDSDEASQPYLNAIYTHPHIQLYPEFSPLTTDYMAFVDYSITLVEIVGIPKNCLSTVRLEDREEGNVFNNFSVGIGQNTAHLLVMGTTSMGELYTLNTYRITLHRPAAGHDMGKFDNSIDHQVCSIKQDCTLPMSESEPCGLQTTHFSSWTKFVQHETSLGQCGSDSTSAGHWMVPCNTCRDSNTCYWKNATWHQTDCREKYLLRPELEKCLHQKKVLFIGDSTNRGILHYIVHRLNGSLVKWDKTHNISLYTGLNNGHTIFGFAYYPQFWLSSKEQPHLDKALFQLFKRTLSTFDPVIVLGGVHWLVRRHLDILADFLSSMGLTNTKVIIKGLGAGFHQPVRGIRQRSLEDHHRLYVHNQAVLSYAKSKGFSVVDTFGMTMARYKEFLPGKCACHFHKVVPAEQSIVQKLFSQGSQDPQTTYTVEGEINALYSEMIINRICSLS